jgi:hypothetical protein
MLCLRYGTKKNIRCVVLHKISFGIDTTVSEVVDASLIYTVAREADIRGDSCGKNTIDDE